MILRFTSQISVDAEQWTQQLIDCPGDLEAIERTVHKAYARGADLLVAGMMAATIKDGKFMEAAEQTRQTIFTSAAKRSRTPHRRSTSRGHGCLGGDAVLRPKKKRFRKDDAPRVGLDITFISVRIWQRRIAGFGERVARQMALCPRSRLLTKNSLARVRSRHQGDQANHLSMWRRIVGIAATPHRSCCGQGKLKASSELAGKRVSVQIDGGRMKIRGEMKPKPASLNRPMKMVCSSVDAPGRSKSKPRRTFAADWREPKLMTIFIHDEHGKMVKKTKATIDGTLLGPDAIAEIVAMHLHRLVPRKP